MYGFLSNDCLKVRDIHNAHRLLVLDKLAVPRVCSVIDLSLNASKIDRTANGKHRVVCGVELGVSQTGKQRVFRPETLTPGSGVVVDSLVGRTKEGLDRRCVRLAIWTAIRTDTGLSLNFNM